MAKKTDKAKGEAKKNAGAEKAATGTGRKRGGPRKFTHEQVRKALQDADGMISTAAEVLGCTYQTVCNYINADEQAKEILEESRRRGREKLRQTAYEKALNGDTTMLIFLLKTLCRNEGYVEGKPQEARRAIPGAVKEIMQRVLNGETSVRDAAIEIERMGEPLPESLRILLSRESPPPVDPTGGAYCPLSDEEMEARVRERLAAQEEQRQGLPARREAMQALHEQMHDSFAAGAAPTAPQPQEG